MPPAPAADDLCPCGSASPFAACCGDVIRARTRLTKDALEHWARERGVLEQLDVAASAIVTVHRSAGALPRWLRVELTVGVLLAPGNVLPAAVVAQMQAMRATAWEWLRREIEIVREGSSIEAKAPVPPAAGTLAAIFDKLRALRREVRRTASPRAVGRLTHCTLHLDPDARRAVFVERRRTSPQDSGGMVDPKVVLLLAGPRDEALPVPACTCERDHPCMHVLAAIDLALAQLSDPARRITWDALARAIDTPDWARVLAALDAVHLASRDDAARAGSVRYSFLVRDDAAYGPNVTVLRQRRKRDGNFGRATQVRPGELGDGPGPCAAEDRTALQRLGILGKQGSPYSYHYGEVGPRPRDLLALAGHPRVFAGAELASPIAVRGATLGIALRPVDGGGTEIAFTAAGEELPFERVASRLTRSDGTFLWMDRDRRLCLVVEVANPELTRAVVSALVRHGRQFPAEAESALLERIGPLQELLPVEVPAGLEGEEVPPSPHVVLRLALLESGLGLRVLARPLDGAPAHPPGEGPARLIASRAAGRVFARRDAEAERQAAHAVLDSLPLAGTRESAPFERIVDDDDAALALLDHLRALDRPDVTVEWAGPPPRVVRAASARGLRVEIRDRNDWFGIDGVVELDGERVKLALLLDALRERRTVIRLEGGAWLAITGQLAERLALLAHLSSPAGDGVEIGPAALGALDDLARDGAELDARGAFARLHARMKESSRRTPRVPRSFKGKLRDYQVEGFRWLARLSAWGAGAILADDMGLGKTLQALALLCHRASEGPALVVAPTSVCANWVAEARRFAPSLNVILFRETDRIGAVEALGPGDVLVVSYGLLVLDLARFEGKRFATLVLDEAQAIKNAVTRRARACREIDAEFRVALSGTPIENHVGELWSLFRVAFPGLLGSWELFRRRFALPIERERDPGCRRALAATLRPFLLRRTKAEVARELPSRTEMVLPVALSSGERRLYEQARLAAVARLAGPGDRVRPEQRRFQVLAAITELRLLACHPRLYEPESPLRSSKLARFLELAGELVEGGHRALVFSQFTSHLALVREALAAARARFLYLDGQTPPAERDRLVERFQAGEGDLFLISLKAGGTGLNLTGADYVVHLDPWWNPAVEDQATDRAHRIGQRKPVTVYRLLSQGTLEETIVRLHEKKRELVAGVLDGMDGAGRLSSDELTALIRSGPQDAATDDAVRTDEAVAAESEPAAGPAEEDSVHAEAEETAGVPAGPGQRPPRGVTRAHDALLERFRHHLLREFERRRFGSLAPVKGYPRAVRRFFEHLSSEGIRGGALRDELADLVPRYLDGLRTGSIAAPDSEPILARSALGELTRFLAAESDSGTPNPGHGRGTR